jgi:hypothetical protein
MDRLKISVEYQYGFVHNASVICMIILPVYETSEVPLNCISIGETSEKE